MWDQVDREFDYSIQLCKQRQYICDIITSLNKRALERSICLFNSVRTFKKYSLSWWFTFCVKNMYNYKTWRKIFSYFLGMKIKKWKTYVNHSKKNLTRTFRNLTMVKSGQVSNFIAYSYSKWFIDVINYWWSRLKTKKMVSFKREKNDSPLFIVIS